MKLPELWKWGILTPERFGTNVPLINMVNSPWVRMERVAQWRGHLRAWLCLFLLQQMTPLLKAFVCALTAASLFGFTQWPRGISLPLLWCFSIDHAKNQLWPCHVPPSSSHWQGCRSYRLITAQHNIDFFIYLLIGSNCTTLLSGVKAQCDP